MSRDVLHYMNGLGLGVWLDKRQVVKIFIVPLRAFMVIMGYGFYDF